MRTDRRNRRTRGWTRLIGLAAAAVALGALALPSAASAARGLTTGFAGTETYQSKDPQTTKTWIDRTVDAGAGLVRLSVGWGFVAPTRPADPTNPGSISYDFSGTDDVVRQASARGLSVMITVNIAPTWAEGPGKPASATEGTWKPNPADLADFDQAIAARYSGNFDPDGIGPQPVLPAVQALEVWNEPNSSDWLTPQFQGKTPTSPDLYRDMLNASDKSVKSVNPKMQVIAAGTDPYGDKPGGPYPPGVQRVQPLTFWQQVLCVQPKKSKKAKKGSKKTTTTKYVRKSGCSGSAQFDIFAHHPIDNTGGGPLVSGPLPGDISTPDLGKLVSVLRAGERFGTAPGGHHPVWVTEFWWDSKPPNPVGAPLATQARWVEQSLYLFWKAGANTAVNFEIGDSSSRPDVHAGLQSGVYFQDGRPKPSLTAFRFPFVTEQVSTRTLNAWGKAPEAGKLIIQRQQGSRWINVRKLQATKGGVFTTKLKLSGKQRLRAKVGSSQSLVWKQSPAGAKKSSDDGGPGTALIIVLIGGGIGLIAGGTAVLRRRQLHRHRGTRAAIG